MQEQLAISKQQPRRPGRPPAVTTAESGDGKKMCPTCKRELERSEFGLCSAREDGRNLYCKRCINKKSQQSRTALSGYRRRRRAQLATANAQAKALGELDEDEKPRRAHAERYIDAKPEHFIHPWPTVRTQTFVEMVFGSIKKRGAATQDDILEDTGLENDTVGMALADLLLWQKSVSTKIDELEETRFYFVNEETRR